MSDEPLPVTLDNIRKWDADMRGSDDRARHIALYYFATNLREVVGVLFAELAEARDKALEEAAGELERLDGFGEWHEAAQTIRALKSRSHTLSDLIASTADEYLSPKPPIL